MIGEGDAADPAVLVAMTISDHLAALFGYELAELVLGGQHKGFALDQTSFPLDALLRRQHLLLCLLQLAVQLFDLRLLVEKGDAS
ncbi:hypothetical protein [Rhizobium beringeri]|uniref:hypothetical protein n=1 Tax=Rhizobium beringeri TaxID=3019934 RepID=UPI003B59191E